MFNLKCAIFQIFLTRASLQTIYNVGKIVTVKGSLCTNVFFLSPTSCHSSGTIETCVLRAGCAIIQKGRQTFTFVLRSAFDFSYTTSGCQFMKSYIPRSNQEIFLCTTVVSLGIGIVDMLAEMSQYQVHFVINK